NAEDVCRKPFRIPDVIHLLTEVSHLILGLDLRPGDRVLDFGCGTGWTSRILHACGCEVVGVDVSETALAMARSLAGCWKTAGLGSPNDGVALDFLGFDGVSLAIE